MIVCDVSVKDIGLRSNIPILSIIAESTYLQHQPKEVLGELWHTTTSGDIRILRINAYLAQLHSCVDHELTTHYVGDRQYISILVQISMTLPLPKIELEPSFNHPVVVVSE